MKHLHPSIALKEILLDPSMPTSRVYSVRPTNIVKSIIDISQLEHLDDVKNDNFGTWKHSGSHPQLYRVHVEDDGDLHVEKCALVATGDDVVYL